MAYIAGAFSKVDYVLPEKLSDFTKEDTKVSGCISGLFPNISNMKEENNKPDDINDGNKVDKDFFKDTSASTLQGCLVVNWDKEETTAKDKGTGTFRFLGAVKEGNKGFIVFAAAENKSDATNKKLSGNGVAYTLEDKDKNGNGERKGKLKKENIDQNKESDLGSGFPKPGEALEKAKDKTFGGLFKDKEGLKEACSSGCGDGSIKSSFRGYGTLEEANTTNPSAKDLKNGTTSLSTGWEKLFEENKGDMSAAIEGKKVTGKEWAFFEEPK